MRTSRDSFADIERVKRDLEGAHLDLDKVFNRAAANYTSVPTNSGSPVNGGYYPQTYIQNPPITTGSVRSYPATHGTVIQGRTLSPPPQVGSHAPLVIRSGPSTHIGSPYPTLPARPAETISSPQIRYTTMQGGAVPGTTTTTTVNGHTTIFSGTQQPGQGDIQELIFNTIEEYVEGRTKIVGEAGRQRIAKMLLPPEVNLLFTQQPAVTKDFMDILAEDKKCVDKYSDNRSNEISTTTSEL